MSLIRYILLVLSCLAFRTQVCAQTTANDSLISILHANLPDSVRAKAALGLSELHVGNQDSVFKYTSIALEISSRTGLLADRAHALTQRGMAFYSLSRFDSAIYLFEKAVPLRIATHNRKSTAMLYNNLGSVFQKTGNYPKALAYYIDALKIFEELSENAKLATIYNNIGVIYENIGDYSKSLEYYQRSLRIREQLPNNLAGKSLVTNNVGVLFDKLNQYDSALIFFHRALVMEQQLGSEDGMSYALANLGAVYFRAGQLDSAKKYLTEAIDLERKLGDEYLLSSTLVYLGMYWAARGNHLTAIRYAQEGYRYAESIGALLELKEASETLSKSYAAIDSFKLAYSYQLKAYGYKDSLFNEQNRKEIGKLELEQSQFENSLLQKDNQLQEALLLSTQKELQRQSVVIWAGSIGVILLMFFIYWLYRGQHKLNKKNKDLLSKNAEIVQKNEEIFQQREELVATVEVVQTQKAEIERINDEITSSINYAFRIQQAILPTTKTLRNYFPDSFIFNRPRDIVSGDFYFFAHCKPRPIYKEAHTPIGTQRVLVGFTSEKFIIAVADCTGHGVPGAFMSTIGNQLLYEIVVGKGIDSPDMILHRLHGEVQRMLNQEENDNADGMDIAIVAYTPEEKVLEFAGAMNPCYYVEGGVFKEIKGDKIPIGGAWARKEGDFNVSRVNVTQPLAFYLCTDGFQDQFGGPKGRKFMTKQLKELLLGIHQYNMSAQHTILSETLNEWMSIGDEQQVDDILIVGFRIIP